MSSTIFFSKLDQLNTINNLIAVNLVSKNYVIHEPYPSKKIIATNFDKYIYLPYYQSDWKTFINNLKMAKIKNIPDLKNYIKSNMNFNVLEYYTKNENERFFYNKLLPAMIDQLTIMTDITLTTQIPILKQNSNASITFSQYQIFLLLINGFFCTFPDSKNNNKLLDNINFNKLFSAKSQEELLSKYEKMKCLMNYFIRLLKYDKYKLNLITFFRKSINPANMPNWLANTKKLSNLIVNSTKKIEDNEMTLQVDFANSFVGGGVLGHGLVQEEILFLISPELIVSKLFTERLLDNEVLIITGFERYSDYTGYSSKFKYTGEYNDKTKVIFTPHGYRKLTYLVAMDAKIYSPGLNQYSTHEIIRELNKSYVAFSPDINIENLNKKLATVSTGHWGCGAFRGDPELKSLIQLLAASYCGRDIIYSTFNDTIFENKLNHIHSILIQNSITTKDLYKLLIDYDMYKSKYSSLFNFIEKKLNN